jgi:hypothetical protein
MGKIDEFSLRAEYENILYQIKELEYYEIVDRFFDILPVLWTKNYKTFSSRLPDICIISNDSFHYIFDDETTHGSDTINDTINYESRIVAAYGISKLQINQRDDGRLKGWIGKTEERYGKSWDKGHFIAHSIGGEIDRNELNVFPQKRTLNRGWSPQGKIYRKMERYCSENKGIFCFNRPIYFDETSIPSLLEFGILTIDKNFWIEMFDNRE